MACVAERGTFHHMAGLMLHALRQPTRLDDIDNVNIVDIFTGSVVYKSHLRGPASLIIETSSIGCMHPAFQCKLLI